ncbi:hypothetical protein M3J09_013607 [Ascochyta lentis]
MFDESASPTSPTPARSLGCLRLLLGPHENTTWLFDQVSMQAKPDDIRLAGEDSGLL